MITEKGLLITAGVVFVGFVGYRILKKKKPEVIKKFKAQIVGLKEKSLNIVEGAKVSFSRGYANATA